VVNINSVSQRFDIVFLCTVKVTHLNFILKAFQVVYVLAQVIFPEELKTESLISFHHSESLLVLNGFINLIRTVRSKDFEKVIHGFLKNHNFGPIRLNRVQI